MSIERHEINADNYQLADGRHAVTVYFDKRSSRGTLADADELRRFILSAPAMLEMLKNYNRVKPADVYAFVAEVSK